MRSPFPGMDPYLENPVFWPGFHNGLLAAVADWLGPVLRPRYYVSLELRVYELSQEDFDAIGVPDIAVAPTSARRNKPSEPSARSASPALVVEIPTSQEVKDVYLEVHDASSNELVTILELLTPANKIHPSGRAQYLKKRDTIFRSSAALVEIDLLRAGKRMPLQRAPILGDYRILVSRASERPRAQLHAFDVRDPIPRFHLPLLAGDAEPEVDVGAILNVHYDRLSYDLRMDYSRPAVPALASKDAAWARSLLKAAGKLPTPLASPRMGARRRALKPSGRSRKKARRR